MAGVDCKMLGCQLAAADVVEELQALGVEAGSVRPSCVGLLVVGTESVTVSEPPWAV